MEFAEIFQLVTEFEVWRVRLARLAKKQRQNWPTEYFFGQVRDDSDRLSRSLHALELEQGQGQGKG
jgi:hypothetical protein